jgi:chlorobactene glucosyltransferase
MMLLACLVTGALLTMLAISVDNARRFPRLSLAQRSDGDQPQVLPSVSILIPARNEAATIGSTVRSLLDQTYPQLEVIVLDDGSTDGTATVAQRAGQGDARLSIQQGAPLPAGWGGKNWACHQLAGQARHDLLLFTDADVRWQPSALAAVVGELQQRRADLLTVWPTQITHRWGERLVVPLMGLAVLAYLPVWLAHETPYPAAAAANGQCLLFQREAYAAIGGHAAVRGEIVEDVRLAQRIKAAGLRLRMADGAGLVQTRMYHTWADVRNGFAKNILAGHWNSQALLFGSTLFHLLLFVWPWLWLMAGFLGFNISGRPWWPGLLVLLGIGVRMVTARATRQRLLDALAMPCSALLMSWIAAQALWWRWRYGGPVWKGRVMREG